MQNPNLRIFDPANSAARDRQNLPLAPGVKHQVAATVQFPRRASSAGARASSAGAVETCVKTPQPNVRELPTGSLRRNAACLDPLHAPPCEVN
jgi:hypothetical protein